MTLANRDYNLQPPVKNPVLILINASTPIPQKTKSNSNSKNKTKQNKTKKKQTNKKKKQAIKCGILHMLQVSNTQPYHSW